MSGKYRRDASPSGQTRQLSGEWNEPPVRDREKLYDTIEVLVDVAAAHGATPAQVALQWLLQLAPNLLLIPGTASVAHLWENLAAEGVTLDEEALRQLDGVGA